MGSSPARDSLDELDRLAAEVVAEAAAIGASLEAARPFVGAVREALARHRVERSVLRRELGLVPGLPAAPPGDRSPDLGALRAAQEALVFAHVEAVGRVGPPVTGVLVGHLRELASHLTVTELWLEREASDE